MTNGANHPNETKGRSKMENSKGKKTAAKPASTRKRVMAAGVAKTRRG